MPLLYQNSCILFKVLSPSTIFCALLNTLAFDESATSEAYLVKSLSLSLTKYFVKNSVNSADCFLFFVKFIIKRNDSAPSTLFVSAPNAFLNGLNVLFKTSSKASINVCIPTLPI